MDETAAALVEYGLLLALLALVAFTAIGMFGRAVSALFNPPSSPFGGH
jgi:Flp pilus assembly pilin Flp